MLRRTLALALLLAGVSAAAAERSAPPVVQSAKETMPATKQAAGAERKPVERKPGEAQKSSPDISKPPLPLLNEKNLGLGCAQG
jgi:hypothetical protein